MPDPGWYPLGQVCYPPELPAYLKNVHDLKPIAGVPSDAEIIGLHSVIHAANRVSGVPGMHDPRLFMKLSDHLFNAQMARYRSKYSLITFPSTATYTPPVLPAHVSVNLEPVAGAPSDEEIIGVQDAVRAYERFSGVAPMFDPQVHMELSQHLFDIQMARHMRLAGEVQPSLEPQASAIPESPAPSLETPQNTTELANHLFNAQMARYRSKYSLITFPSTTTYTPPVLPAHVSVNLEPVAGAPSDEEIIEVQDAVRAYERFSGVAPMFDPQVHMELSQHLFDIQMARHMRLAGEVRPSLEPQASAIPESPAPSLETPQNTTEVIGATNNAGTGENATGVHQATLSAAGFDVRELMERSNQLAERFNQALEQFTKLAERTNTPTEQPDYLTERFDRLFERFNQVVEQANQSAQQANQFAERSNQFTERSNQFAERSNQLNERSNQLFEQLLPSIGQPNQLGERLTSLLEGFNQHLRRSNELSEKANESSNKLNGLTERSNRLSERASQPVERLEGVMKNINRVLVGIQHAIVRNHKENTLHALDCLVNEAGEVPEVSELTSNTSFGWLLNNLAKVSSSRVPLVISGTSTDLYIPTRSLGGLLHFLLKCITRLCSRHTKYLLNG
ncbi:hypothetical protein RSAG8_08094, partial [Rhizoctonia solani AG-8 WAC10335]